MQKLDWENFPREELEDLFAFLNNECKEHFAAGSLKQVAKIVKIDYTSYTKALNGNWEISENRYRKFIRKILKRLDRQLSQIEGTYVLSGDQSTQPIENEFHYIYYYIASVPNPRAEFKIRKAQLRLRPNANAAELIFYNGPVPVVSYSGELDHADGSPYLYFKQRRTFSLDKVLKLPALNHLNCSWDAIPFKHYIISTFTSKGPSAGVAILEKTAPETIAEKITDEEVPPEVIRMMIGKRFDITGFGADLFDHSLNMDLIEKIRTIEGTYLAFCLENHLLREGIHRFKLEIFNGCIIRYHSRLSNEHRGYIIDFNNDILKCQFDYNSKIAHFDMVMNLRVLPDMRDDVLPEGAIIGTFCGLDHESDPMAGRILLIPTKKPYAEIQPRMYRLTSDDEIDGLFKKYPYLVDFFLGRLDRFVDSPELMKKFLTSQDIEPKVKNGEIARYAGTYLNYRISSYNNSIYSTPFRIYENGDVMLWLKEEGEETETKVIGSAEYLPNGIISIFYDDRGSTDVSSRRFHHLIYVGNRNLREMRFMEGVCTSVTKDFEPRCSREIYQVVQLDDIKSERIKNYPDKDLAKITDTDKERIYYYLSSRVNNLIVGRQRPNPDFEETNLRKAQVLMESAIILARQRAEKKQIIDLLKHALQMEPLISRELAYQVTYGVLSRSDLGIKLKTDWDGIEIVFE